LHEFRRTLTRWFTVEYYFGSPLQASTVRPPVGDPGRGFAVLGRTAFYGHRGTIRRTSHEQSTHISPHLLRGHWLWCTEPIGHVKPSYPSGNSRGRHRPLDRHGHVFRSRIYGPRCSFSRWSIALSRKQRHFLAFIASSAPPLKKTPCR